MVVVLVNGLPGAGKTTLARQLAQLLKLPLLAKDDIKETMADILGSDPTGAHSSRGWSQSLGAASIEVMWTLLASAHSGAVLETPLLAGVRHLAEAGLRRAGVDPTRIHEVWCDIPASVAQQRFEDRAAFRHPIHGNQIFPASLWEQYANDATPLGFGFVHRVDTSQPVDASALAWRITLAAGSVPLPDGS